MSSKNAFAHVIAAALALAIGAAAHSAPPASSGTLAFTPVTLSDSGGAPIERAVVAFQNKDYEITLNGLGVGGAKGVKVAVSGEVYGLNRVEDLEGVFVSELADAPPKEVSSDDLWLYSERGVSLRLHTDNPAITLATGGDTVTVQFGWEE